ncbi:MAG: hypothetical protein NT121_25475 [Chloroflexi bacterium]|nr:hypothetical protein [Chloroflexota bacterium]
MSETISPVSRLREEFSEKQALFNAQPPIVQRFIEAQARQIADALIEHRPQAKFTLPDRVVAEMPQIDQPATITVPTSSREQSVGGLRTRITRQDVKEELRHRLTELEQSPDHAISTSAGLLRFAAANHMVHNMLPSGRSVTYRADDDEDIPTIPTEDMAPESAITQDSDAIAEEGKADEGRGNLQVPFVPAARRFYLPQWVSFDDNGKLLVGSVKEAEAHLSSMERYIAILHAASSIAPYIIADDEYQKKRYGMLGQLINQGRALARYKTREIIQTIKDRAKAGSLNRGLSLSLPYYDDQELNLAMTSFEVIPAGRIMFVPAFVVRAAREEAAKRIQDTRFNPSTRKHLMAELQMLEDAFFQA